MKYIKKADIIYISTLVLTILGFSGFLVFGNFGNSDTVTIEVDGEIFGQYNLNINQQIDIDVIGHNTVVIEDGKVYMSCADCPDKVCMSHYPITSNLGSIVCLPNKVVVSLNSVNDNGVDLVT